VETANNENATAINNESATITNKEQLSTVNNKNSVDITQDEKIK
jgi:hypothetical protein